MSALIVTEKAGIFGRARLLLEIDPRKRSAYATLLPLAPFTLWGAQDAALM